jgi:sn-glycerol 3-phosphate transport system permease protein
MSAAVHEGDRIAAATATRRRRRSGALTHAVLLLGVLAVVFPIWIAVVGSTHDASTIGRGDVPLLPGAEAVENYATR